MGNATSEFAGRAGEKLDGALTEFHIDLTGAVCADFGANVGGFTDCLLRRGAARVYAVDTGYGDLAWRLRKDPRVVVMERTNVLHCPVPEPVDLVTVDVAWTPQQRVVPAAAAWLRSDGGLAPLGIVTLLKPHYELAKIRGQTPHQPLTDDEAEDVCRRVCDRLAEMGFRLRARIRSPLRGKGGNVEHVLWLQPVAARDETEKREC